MNKYSVGPRLKRFLMLGSFGMCFCAYVSAHHAPQMAVEDVKVTVYDARVNQLLSEKPKLELLAQNLGWAEGPLWLKQEQALLFSDIQNNQVLKWKEGQGVTPYLFPSGHERDDQPIAWRGANGLALSPTGQLVLAQQGGRTLSVMNASISSPEPSYTIWADKYSGKKLNSPNDLVFTEDGTLLFTDPPYGLNGFENSPLVELPFFGVYALSPKGKLAVLVDELRKPNGIAYHAGLNTVLVSDSDHTQNKIFAFDLNNAGRLVNKRLFFDANEHQLTGPGSVDGLKFHSSGWVFSALPNGIGILDASGQLMARLEFGQVCNLAFNDDMTHLYITAPHRLIRLTLNQM